MPPTAFPFHNFSDFLDALALPERRATFNRQIDDAAPSLFAAIGNILSLSENASADFRGQLKYLRDPALTDCNTQPAPPDVFSGVDVQCIGENTNTVSPVSIIGEFASDPLWDIWPELNQPGRDTFINRLGLIQSRNFQVALVWAAGIDIDDSLTPNIWGARPSMGRPILRDLVHQYTSGSEASGLGAGDAFMRRPVQSTR